MSDTTVRRVFVEKREGFDVEARQLCGDIRERLGLNGLKALRVLKRYDLSGVSDAEYAAARDSILSEPNCDTVYEENLPLGKDEVPVLAFPLGKDEVFFDVFFLFTRIRASFS